MNEYSRERGIMITQTRLSSEFSSISASAVADTDSDAKAIKFMGLDWEKYRPLLHQLYVDEDRSLDQVMEYMHKKLVFNAKYVFLERPLHILSDLNTRKRIYKMKFKLWEIEKNIPARDMKGIVALVEKRKREHGKDSHVYYKGRLVDARKMDRFKKRKLAATTSDEEESVGMSTHTRLVTTKMHAYGLGGDTLDFMCMRFSVPLALAYSMPTLVLFMLANHRTSVPCAMLHATNQFYNISRHNQ